jgi:hypothetical protein
MSIIGADPIINTHFSLLLIIMKIIHYTTLEIGFTHIIQTEELRFGPLSSTNDPHEYKKRARALSMDIRSLLVNKDSRKNALPNMKKAEERIKIGCFVDEPVQDWRKGKGIKKPRMWAQYGGNHTGMAFVFDKDLFVEKCKENVVDNWAVHGNNVEYDLNSELSPISTPTISFNVTEEITETLIAKKVFEKAKNHLYKKHHDWQDENEYRIIIYTETHQFEFINISSSLEAVVLGDRAGETTRDMMMNSFKNKGVEVCKLIYSTSQNGYKLV